MKSNYAEWRRREKYESAGASTAVNFSQAARITTSAMDATPQERQALYEDRWQSGGLALYLVYEDVFTNFDSNETISEFLREKIRERVNNPALAKRLCADNGYYETYSRDNVSLVDIRGATIGITPKGIRSKGVEQELDSIIFATGFDALTGALTRMDIRGRNGRPLQECWSEGAVTAFGLMTAGFPNLFFLNGPGSPCPLYQPVLLAEEQVGWVGDWLNHMRDKGLSLINGYRMNGSPMSPRSSTARFFQKQPAGIWAPTFPASRRSGWLTSDLSPIIGASAKTCSLPGFETLNFAPPGSDQRPYR